jgi:hypothetical protein
VPVHNYFLLKYSLSYLLLVNKNPVQYSCITCTHAHIHRCTDAQMHTCTHAHMHTCTHAHMHTCTHAHMHTCTHAHMHTCLHAHGYFPTCDTQHFATDWYPSAVEI